MEEQEKQNEMTDDDIIAAYNANAVEAETAERESEEAPKAEKEQAEPKKKKRGIKRHLYPCPHCGEQILDHFTQCPKCGGEVTPRGYHVDEGKRKKIVRVFQIGGAILSVALVIVLAIVLNR